MQFETVVTISGRDLTRPQRPDDTTGETSWEKPAAGAGANAVAQERTDSTAVDAKGAEIAALWVEAKTDDGRTYYVNTLTDETSWERPSAPH